MTKKLTMEEKERKAKEKINEYLENLKGLEPGSPEYSTIIRKLAGEYFGIVLPPTSIEPKKSTEEPGEMDDFLDDDTEFLLTELEIIFMALKMIVNRLQDLENRMSSLERRLAKCPAKI
jgi:hypothetical protein